MTSPKPEMWEYCETQSPDGQEWLGCGVTMKGSTSEFVWLEDDPETDIPRAHLIAAAPDMLEALEAAQAMHQRYCDRVAAADDWARSLKSQIDAAIAKAKGGDA